MNELYTAYLVKYNEYCKTTEHPMDEDAWIAAQWFLDNLELGGDKSLEDGLDLLLSQPEEKSLILAVRDGMHKIAYAYNPKTFPIGQKAPQEVIKLLSMIKKRQPSYSIVLSKKGKAYNEVVFTMDGPAPGYHEDLTKDPDSKKTKLTILRDSDNAVIARVEIVKENGSIKTTQDTIEGYTIRVFPSRAAAVVDADGCHLCYGCDNPAEGEDGPYTYCPFCRTKLLWELPFIQKKDISI